MNKLSEYLVEKVLFGIEGKDFVICKECNKKTLQLTYAHLSHIHNMTINEYKNKYFSDENGAEKLWLILKKVCDLNIDRNNAMDKLDMKIIKIIEGKVPVQNT